VRPVVAFLGSFDAAAVAAVSLSPEISAVTAVPLRRLLDNRFRSVDDLGSRGRVPRFHISDAAAAAAGGGGGGGGSGGVPIDSATTVAAQPVDNAAATAVTSGGDDVHTHTHAHTQAAQTTKQNAHTGAEAVSGAGKRNKSEDTRTGVEYMSAEGEWDGKRPLAAVAAADDGAPALPKSDDDVWGLTGHLTETLLTTLLQGR
jgi:hypothetical protein